MSDPDFNLSRRGPTPHWSLWADRHAAESSARAQIIVGEVKGPAFDSPNSIRVIASFTGGTLTTGLEADKAPPPSIVPKEQSLLWTVIARALTSRTQFQREWQPHIDDMNFEYAERLRQGRPWAARWAVLRAHYYSVPTRVWVLAATGLLWVVHRFWG